MAWVLIYVIFYGAPSTGAPTFSTKEACEEARNWVTTTSAAVKAKCFPTGINNSHSKG